MHITPATELAHTPTDLAHNYTSGAHLIGNPRGRELGTTQKLFYTRNFVIDKQQTTGIPV